MFTSNRRAFLRFLGLSVAAPHIPLPMPAPAPSIPDPRTLTTAIAQLPIPETPLAPVLPTIGWVSSCAVATYSPLSAEQLAEWQRNWERAVASAPVEVDSPSAGLAVASAPVWDTDDWD